MLFGKYKDSWIASLCDLKLNLGCDCEAELKVLVMATIYLGGSFWISCFTLLKAEVCC